MVLHQWKTRLADGLSSGPPKQLERAFKRQIARASGTEFFAHRDPVYHIGESFQQTFALLGQRQKNNALYAKGMEEPGGLGSMAAASDKSYGTETLIEHEQEFSRRRFEEKTSMDGLFAPKPGNEDFLSRFSETAFNRGALSGAVMRGTGRMMLVSCLKRTAGQSQPKNFRQRMLFENASAMRNINGRSPDKAVFNKGDIDSAVGLVIDVTRDARRAVDSLADLTEKGFEGSDNSGTLQKMYPFLSIEKEQALLEQYKQALSSLSGPEAAEKRLIIQRAALKTQAVIAKKRQMRSAFIHHLRSLSDQAAAALHVFQQDDFRAAAFEALASPPQDEPEDEDTDE